MHALIRLTTGGVSRPIWRWALASMPAAMRPGEQRIVGFVSPATETEAVRTVRVRGLVT